MKTRLHLARRAPRLALAVALLSTLNPQLSTLFAQGTAFTYQGVLREQGAPVDGVYDLQFNLFAAPAGGSPIGSLASANDQAISNGLFTVTLDFGVGVFNGPARWLEIRVRPGDSTANYTNLSPRQALLPAPYAIYAGGVNAAGLIGTIAASNIADGTITSNKLAANSVTSTHLATGAVTTADLAVDAVTASRLADSFQEGFLPFSGSSTGATVVITFPRPFESAPSVTLDSPHLVATNVTAGGFQVRLPPYNLVVDNSPNTVGRYLSMAVVNGNPAIAYYDETSGDLKYCRALTTNGSHWGAPVVALVGGASLIGKFPSLAMVNGRPAVACYDDTLDDLKYVRAGDTNGAAWDPALTVVSVGNVGQYAQLKVVNGQPAIAFFDATTNSLHYVRATDANGAAWGTPVTVEQGATTNVVGEYASMDIVNGRPAIAYRARGVDMLRYCRASNADGTAWNAPVEVSNFPQAGEEVSLAVVNGQPAVAFLARGAEINFKRAADADGTNWIFAGSVVAGVREVGPSGLALRVVAGRPGIAFWHGQGGEVHYADSPFANGGGWRPVRIFGSTGTAGGGVALLDLHGTAVVAGPSSGTGLDLRFSTAALIPNSYSAREVVQIEAASVAAGSITREMLAPGVLGNATPEGLNAFAFGAGAQALNDDAFAIGRGNVAAGLSAFAGGLGASSSGQGAMAFGWNAQAMASAAIALGDNTFADQVGQVAVGRYNRPTVGAVFVVGNGSFSGRNNALWVQNNGDLEITGAGARKPGGGSWTTPSDARLKDVHGAFQRGLEALRGIQPVSYQYKSDPSKKLPNDTHLIGVVAQEVERNIPEAVSRDEQGYRMVNNDPILWTMLNAIKELEARLEVSAAHHADARPAERSRAQPGETSGPPAAIEELNEKAEVRSDSSKSRIQKLETENAELKQRLRRLEQLVQSTSGSVK